MTDSADVASLAISAPSASGRNASHVPTPARAALTIASAVARSPQAVPATQAIPPVARAARPWGGRSVGGNRSRGADLGARSRQGNFSGVELRKPGVAKRGIPRQRARQDQPDGQADTDRQHSGAEAARFADQPGKRRPGQAVARKGAPGLRGVVLRLAGGGRIRRIVFLRDQQRERDRRPVRWRSERVEIVLHLDQQCLLVGLGREGTSGGPPDPADLFDPVARQPGGDCGGRVGQAARRAPRQKIEQQLNFAHLLRKHGTAAGVIRSRAVIQDGVGR